MSPNAPLKLIVAAVTTETDRVKVFELRRPEGGALPPFTAGAHIDLEIGQSGLLRQYSLLNHQAADDRYVVAVAREAESRGGSIFLHDEVEVGDLLRVGGPRNHFPLDEGAPHSVLIAGGIGITPIWSMAQQLEAVGASWELHYAAPSEDQAPLLGQIKALAGDRLHLYFSRAPDGRRIDPADIVWETNRPDAHFYCCGPISLMDSFAKATARLPPSHVHLEHFTPMAAPAVDGGFTLVLARSKLTLDVPPGHSILQTLRENGLQASYSCTEGVCGSCETTVLEGLPDHRDSVLTPTEQAANRTMMICCSGSKTAKLVLDM
jgi:ferredoxin-NADP reductase